MRLWSLRALILLLSLVEADEHDHVYRVRDPLRPLAQTLESLFLDGSTCLVSVRGMKGRY